MVEIRYRDYLAKSNLAGLSVAEARQRFRGEFGVPDKAIAKLNGKKVKTSLEAETYLSDGDGLCFTKAMSRGTLITVGALLALALCGTFVYGFANNTATLTVSSATSNFATVTASASAQPVMQVYGSFKGTIGACDLFYIEPATGFPGDLIATLSLTNADRLVKCYRMMALLIEAHDSSDTLVDINLDTYNNNEDYALLTLNNGAVDLNLHGADNYTIKLKSGYYVSHTYSSSWSSGETSPIICCDVSHR